MQIKIDSTGLIERNGIYYSKNKSLISYPENGNKDFFQIEENSFWFQHRNNCIKEAVRKYCPNNVFYDIGGGNGYVAKGLEEAGITTVLVEPGVHGCLNAKKRQLSNIVCSTLEDAEFAPNTLPTIGLFDVVEHIEDDAKFLHSVYQYLRNEGFVFITVPAYQSLWSNEDIDAGHYRRYSLIDIGNKLQKIGFEAVYSTYIFSVLPLPVFLFRTLPSKVGLNKKAGDFHKHKNEHTVGNGPMSRLINKVWETELRKIAQGRLIPFGSSCLVIAKKGGQATL